MFKTSVTNSMQQSPLEKLTVTQFFKTLPIFYETCRFITELNHSVCQLTLSGIRRIQSINSHTIFKSRFNIIPHVGQGLPSSIFPSGFPTKMYTFLKHRTHARWPARLIIVEIIIPVIYKIKFKSGMQICKLGKSTNSVSG
jgi:hypothetical protein